MLGLLICQEHITPTRAIHLTRPLRKIVAVNILSEAHSSRTVLLGTGLEYGLRLGFSIAFRFRLVFVVGSDLLLVSIGIVLVTDGFLANGVLERYTPVLLEIELRQTFRLCLDPRAKLRPQRLDVQSEKMMCLRLPV